MGKKVYALLFVMFILAGCGILSTEERKGGEENPQPVKQSPSIKALAVDGTSFFSVGDWYNDEKVLIVEDGTKGSRIFLYDIYTEEQKEFFRTNNQIISVEANHDYTYFLIQTTVSDGQAQLLFVDSKGELVYTVEMDSFDVQYVWNPYHQDQVFVTTFFEDWTFQSFLVDLAHQTHEEYMLSQPFAQWVTDSAFAYMPINRDNPLGGVPLFIHKVHQREENEVLKEIVSFSAFKGTLMAVGPKQGEEGTGIYTFYKSDTLQKIQQFSMPLVSDVSGWIIPHHQFDKGARLFYIFQPRSLDMLAEENGFQLLSFSMETGKEEVILERTDNVPFKLSPNGQLGLMGYQLEKLINLQEKKVIPFIELT
jgi:hypothetical protein